MGFNGVFGGCRETLWNVFRETLHGAPAWSAPGFPPRSTRRTTKKANRIRTEGAFVALRVRRGPLRIGFNSVSWGCGETPCNTFCEMLHGLGWTAPLGCDSKSGAGRCVDHRGRRPPAHAMTRSEARRGGKK